LYMETIEKILLPNGQAVPFRREIAQRFFDCRDSKQLRIEEGKSLLSSKDDDFVECYEREYNKLLSHRKVEIDINGDKLVEVFFLKQRDQEAYQKTDPKVRAFADEIVENLRDRFGYPSDVGFETVLFALRMGIVDFKEILN